MPIAKPRSSHIIALKSEVTKYNIDILIAHEQNNLAMELKQYIQID